MRIFQNVRSTAKHVPSIEVNTNSAGAIDKIYVRSNITEVQEEGREEWNIGQEIHYTSEEFLSRLTSEEDSEMLALMVSMLMSEVDMLKSIIMGGE